MPNFVTCTDCNRVLLEKDGPTCPECLAKQAAKQQKRDDAREKREQKAWDKE